MSDIFVVLDTLPVDLVQGLPEEDQETIRSIIGKPVKLVDHDSFGHAELEFVDNDGSIHSIWVDPSLLKIV